MKGWTVWAGFAVFMALQPSNPPWSSQQAFGQFWEACWFGYAVYAALRALVATIMLAKGRT